MATLSEALAFLLLELESELLHIGRAGMVAQLREATIERRAYDEHAGTAYLHPPSPRSQQRMRNPGAGEPGGKAIVTQLEEYNS